MSDARITPARADLAAIHLRGRVKAKAFVEGSPHGVLVGRAALRTTPSRDASLASELLFGETVTVYERRDGWAWVQAARDCYVGYVREDALGDAVVADHRVRALMTPLLPAPGIKQPVLDMLPLNGRVRVLGREGRFARIAPRGFVYADHLAPSDLAVADWPAVAEHFVGVPYVWGGKTQGGLDCSGLVQTALEAANIACPRDSDMQQVRLGAPVAAAGADLSGLRRGDLVFWAGHVGIMLDAARLIHANAYAMAVAIEPLAEACARMAPTAGAIAAIKRLSVGSR